MGFNKSATEIVATAHDAAQIAAPQTVDVLSSLKALNILTSVSYTAMLSQCALQHRLPRTVDGHARCATILCAIFARTRRPTRGGGAPRRAADPAQALLRQGRRWRDAEPACRPARRQAGAHAGAPRARGAVARARAKRIAAEWEAQREVIDPAKMPLTRLANSIIDGVADAPGPVAARSANISAPISFATAPATPRGWSRARRGIGIRSWLGRATRSARIRAGRGRDSCRAAATRRSPRRAPRSRSDPWRLGALHVVTTLTGSALIALALAHGRLSVERRGRRPMSTRTGTWSSGAATMALERRAFRFAEMQAAAKVLESLDGA